MPATPTPTPTPTVLPEVRHEVFCLPGEGKAEPRMEQFPVYQEHPESGVSRVSHIATRCMECGATHYQKKEN